MRFTALAVLMATMAWAASSAQAAMPANGLYLNSQDGNGGPLIPLLQSVQTSLDIEIYTMEDLQVRALLRSALARGVKIRVVKEPNPDGDTCNLFGTTTSSASDSYGTPTPSATTTADCADQKLLITQIQNAGGTYVPFNKSVLCPNGGGTGGEGCYEHGKIIVADGSLLLLSSGNFDDTNLCIASENPTQCDRDFTMISDDATTVSTFEALFAADLAGTAHDPRTLIPSSLTNTITVSPYSLQPLEDFVSSATTSLDIETQYLDDTELNAAIEAVAKKGVKVTVTVSSLCAFGKPSSYDTKEDTATYTAFDSAGISTSMFNSSNTINGISGYLHNKAIVVDGNRAWVGSENGSNESLNENREYGLFFDDAADVQLLLGVIQADHNSPESETWEESLACQKDSGTATEGGAGGTVGTGGVPNHPPKKPPKPKPKPVPTLDPAPEPKPAPTHKPKPEPTKKPKPEPTKKPKPAPTKKPKPEPSPKPTHKKKSSVEGAGTPPPIPVPSPDPTS